MELRPGAACLQKALVWCWQTSTAARVEAARQALEAENGPDRVRSVLADVTKEDSVCAAVFRAIAEYGGLDILVCNAGIASASPIDETELADWERNMDVLATGYFLCSREGFSLMKRQKITGSIMFRGEQNAVVASAGAAAYSSAKAAAVHLARCLALEGAEHGIRVNVVNPDAVIRGSRIWNGAWRHERAAGNRIRDDEVEEFYRNRSLLKRSVFPEDVAEAIHFFASELSARSTGNILNVDAETSLPSRGDAGGHGSGVHMAEDNSRRLNTLDEDYRHLGRQLARRGFDIEDLTERAMAFRVSVPSWGVGTGGSRFARFPGPGEPRNVFEKLEDCEVILNLVRVTPGISLHIPWDRPDDAAELRGFARAHGLFFDSMNSNTFQDQPGQRLSYKFGSLSHTDPAVRRQAIEHNLECLELGAALGARSIRSGSVTAEIFRGRSTSASRWNATSGVCRRSTRPCPPAGAFSSSTNSTSRPSIPRC